MRLNADQARMAIDMVRVVSAASAAEIVVHRRLRPKPRDVVVSGASSTRPAHWSDRRYWHEPALKCWAERVSSIHGRQTSIRPAIARSSSASIPR